MPAFFRYAFAIFGAQTTTDGGAAVNYRSAPSGSWRWEGAGTSFLVKEQRDTNTNFNGDRTHEESAANLRIDGNRAQTVEIGGTDRQVIWDYTFTVTDGATTWRVGVIDVDLNNSNAIEAGAENGYFLVFPDGFPPIDTNLTTGTIIENDDRTSYAGLGASVVCFAAGTMIETANGPRPIETLEPGDMVLTRDDGYKSLRWAGKSTLDAWGECAPIVVSKNVLSNDVDVVVSAQHALLVEEWRAELLCGTSDVLVRSKDLLNHDGVYRRLGGQVTYCHILFDTHQLVQTSGLWSESLYLGDLTLQTVTASARREIEELFPNLKGYGPKAAQCLRNFEAVCLAL